MNLSPADKARLALLVAVGILCWGMMVVIYWMERAEQKLKSYGRYIKDTACQRTQD